jgi:ribokinase
MMREPSATFTVISIGDLVADIVTAIPRLPVEAGVHQLAHAIGIEPGGAGNLLIAGARLTPSVRMCAMGALGSDAFGEMLAEMLRAEGVDLSDVARDPGTTTTTVLVLVDDAGRHVFVGCYGHGPRVEFKPAWRESIRTADAVFSSGYTLQEERLTEVVLQAMHEAKTGGVPVFFDPGPEMVRVLEAERPVVLALTDVLLLTEEEICLVSSDQDMGQVLGQGPGLAVVKRGDKGCAIFTADSVIECPAFPVEVRDTAAAGDCFDAAFIFGCLKHWPLEQVGRFANAMGAAKIQKLGGGRNVPTADEVRAVLKRFGAETDW